MTDHSSDSTSEDTPTPPLRHAATILVLRQRDDVIEVLMVKRSKKSPFMPNAYVYPGGALDPNDCTMDAFALSEGIEPEDISTMFGESHEPAFGIGLLLAGVRETFEESGLLLAKRTERDHLVNLTENEQTAQHFATLRQQLRAGEVDMLSVARDEGLVLQLGHLGFFSHWVTPFFESRRFNTRFFVARAPVHQTPVHDQHETTDSVWLTAEDAITAYYNEEIMLAPPTLATLMRLREYDSVDAVLAACHAERPAVILPHLTQDGEETVLSFPNDPAFPGDDPQYDMATRGGPWVKMTLRDGLWYPTRVQRES